MKKRTLYRLKLFMTICGALFFAAIIVWFMIGLDRTNSATNEERIKNVKQAVMNGAVLCYSVEGFYPENIDYLKENYGLNYDEKRFLVHYRYVSADICPSVMVYDGSEENRPTEGV